MNAQDVHDLATADKLLREVVVRYPETVCRSDGQIATAKANVS